jgi:hypothetical protein
MTEGRKSLQFALLLTASAGAYAVSLAAVAGFQSASDRAVIDGRVPTADAIDRLAEDSARLEGSLARADAALSGAIARFEATTPALAAWAAELAAVPRITRTTKTVVVHATTGASGG